MARKKKNQLPSGNVRVQVFDYKDASGKKHYKSFTAPTKAIAQMMAAEWKNNRNELKEDLTVLQACKAVYEKKKPVLSPNTQRGYDTDLYRIGNSSIANIQLKSLTNVDLQSFVSELSIYLSPKSVANTFGFTKTAILTYVPRMDIKVTLPKKDRKKRKLYTPNTDEVQNLLNVCDRTDVKIAILFAAVGTMRLSEASAVEFKDLDFKKHTIKIDKSAVFEDGVWATKKPKNDDSIRTIAMPAYVFDLIKTLGRKEGTIIGLNPKQIYRQFRKYMRIAGVKHFRYHDLRHYAASSMHAKGVPERYIEALGGWSVGSEVLRRVYEDVIDSELDKVKESLSKRETFTV